MTLTEKQYYALKLGEAIRNIVCADSIANRFFDPDLREQIRAIADEQMERLGYESLTAHRKRLNEALYNTKDFPPNSFYKYKRITK